MTDMEGVAGVLEHDNWCQPPEGGYPGRYYELGRKFLTEEVNAAIEGLIRGGADDIVVSDGHGAGGINLMLLDPEKLWLVDVTDLRFGNVLLKAPGRIHLEINYKDFTGTIVVPEKSEKPFMVRNLLIESIEPSKVNQDNLLHLEPGEYAFTFRGPVWETSNPLSTLTASSQAVFPEANPPEVINFGLDILHELEVADSITSFSVYSNALLWGDSKGQVTRFEKGIAEKVFQIPSSRSITSLYPADLDGDGSGEIIVGDEEENLAVYDKSGKQLWTYKMKKYFGYNANAADITVGAAGNERKPTIFVATNVFKLYAFESGGLVKWETLIRYHLQTRVKYFHTGDKEYVAVGTEYSTPLSVVSPDDGTVLWYTWDQVGDETNSVTEYCGIHLTDMVFIDTDGDSEKDIVFGTKYNRVYSLNAADGSMKWETNVGDEVTVLRAFDDPASGEKRLLVGTDAGELFLYDRTGRRIRSLSLNSSITGMEVIEPLNHHRVDVIASTKEGEVMACDDRFRIRASRSFKNIPIRSILSGGKSGAAYLFYVVSDRRIYLMGYHPYFLKESRFY